LGRLNYFLWYATRSLLSLWLVINCPDHFKLLDHLTNLTNFLIYNLVAR